MVGREGAVGERGGERERDREGREARDGREGREGRARWARNGCWPNAVLRPVICSRFAPASSAASASTGSPTQHAPRRLPSKDPQDRTASRERDTGDHKQEDIRVRLGDLGAQDTDPPLTFALFATRDLRAHEEVVLGWEWDDGCVVHVLPALVAAGAGAGEEEEEEKGTDASGVDGLGMETDTDEVERKTAGSSGGRRRQFG